MNDTREQRKLAILVGGGPAPGINSVIASATIEAINCGLRVIGLRDGFKWLVEGDASHVVDLTIRDVSRIISPAALLVNVSSRILSGEIPCSSNQATR